MLDKCKTFGKRLLAAIERSQMRRARRQMEQGGWS